MSDEAEEQRRRALWQQHPRRDDVQGLDLFSVPPDDPGQVVTCDPAFDVGLVE